MPEELWTEVHNAAQEEVNKAIPKEKQSKQAEWSSEEALQKVEEQREAKSKGEREIPPSKRRVPKRSYKRHKSLPQ